VDVTNDEVAALQNVVDFVRKCKYSELDGEDAINLYPMCRTLLQLKLKVAEELKKQNEQTMEKMVAKANSADKPKNPIKKGPGGS
jgi:hypothetical protein